MGSRPREPLMLRREVERSFLHHSNRPIQNTAARFKFSSISSRYQAFKRQWTDTLRKMEDGTYSRHRFKADLHQRARHQEPAAAPAAAAGPGASDLFEAYVEARRQCGQDCRNLTPDRLEKVIDKQRRAFRERFGDGEFRFRVVVEKGRAKLKASRVGGAG